MRGRETGHVTAAMSWQPPAVPPPGFAPPGGYPPYTAYPTAGYGSGPTPWGPAPGLSYATFWRRVGGYLIDVLVLAVPGAIGFFVFFGSAFSSWLNAATAASQNNQTVPQLVLPAGALLTYTLLDGLVALLYFGVLVAGWGSTVGQRAVGLRVVCQEDTAKPLPVGRAVLRAIVWWGAALLSLVAGLGFVVELVVLLALLWVAWDPRKQGLHDKLGGALVLRPVGVLPMAAYGPPGSPYGYPPAAYPGPPGYPPPAYPGPPGYPPAPPPTAS